MMSRSSIQVPYFGKEIYLRKVAHLHTNMPKIYVLQVPLYISLVFKAVIAALNELLFKILILSSLISRFLCLYKTVGKATDIFVKFFFLNC
jgi:hypothetical protein